VHRILYNDRATATSAHRANATTAQRTAHRILYNDRANATTA
jgi:hypothetical protein